MTGSAVASATVYAYIVDCVPPASRSRTLSLALGLRFTGMAAGPTICSVLVRLAGTPIAAVAFVIAIHIAHILVVLFVLPESLSKERIEENRQAWLGNRAQQAGNGLHDEEHSVRKALRTTMIALVTLVKPLSILKPATIVSPSGGKSREDWSLTFIATSSGLASMILASYATMFQYGKNVFGWYAEQVRAEVSL